MMPIVEILASLQAVIQLGQIASKFIADYENGDLSDAEIAARWTSVVNASKISTDALNVAIAQHNVAHK